MNSRHLVKLQTTNLGHRSTIIVDVVVLMLIYQEVMQLVFLLLLLLLMKCAFVLSCC